MKKKTERNIVFLLSWLSLFISAYFLGRLSQGQHFNELVFWYALAFTAYFLVLKQAHHFPKKVLYLGTVLFSAVFFLQLPYLSNDYFRFLWDGELIHLGINPYDFTPNQLLQTLPVDRCHYLDLYAGMGNLSQANYSCYPTVNQAYFYIATAFSNDIFSSVLLLRLLIVATVAFSIPYIENLLRRFHFNPKRIFILLLNPLVVVECIGNLHFEYVMVVFLLLAFYFILRDKLFFSALLFAFAVQIKLIPLLALPFLLSFLGWRKAIKYYVYTAGFVLLLFFVFIRVDNYSHFLTSLQLYFNQFEFNSFILYPYLEYGKSQYGWNLISKYGPQLARLAFVIILGIAWNRRFLSKEQFFQRLVLGVMVYYFFTTTVHPWYWVFPLAIALFAFSTSLLLISAMSVLSYGLYSTNVFPDFRIALAIVNGILLLFFLVELTWPRRFQTKIDILH